MARMILNRASNYERLMALVRERAGHRCAQRYTVVALVVWEAVESIWCKSLYDLVVCKVTSFGLRTTRKCALNRARTCACQGSDAETCGACYSFGCAFSVFTNGCKYAKSREGQIRKFKLTQQSEVGLLRLHLPSLICPNISQIILGETCLLASCCCLL